MKLYTVPTLVALCLSTGGNTSTTLADNIRFITQPIESIEIKNDTLFPEGITYNPLSNRFIVGSFRQGAIFEIDQNGNAKIFIEDKRLHSVLAVRVDTKRNRLLALTSDLGASIRTTKVDIKRYAALAIYDLVTGKPLQFVDLSKVIPNTERLVNGMALDNKGNAYITDSFAAAIYKVDVEGKASLFLQDDEFSGEGINLNGIVHHPAGYLLAVKKSSGVLYKIPLNQPKHFKAVISDRKYVGADGLVLAKNNEVIIIANQASGLKTNSAFSVSSNDDWQTMTTVNQYSFGDVYPTTGVLKNGKIFAVYSKLNTLVAAPESEKSNIRQHATIELIGYVE